MSILPRLSSGGLGILNRLRLLLSVLTLVWADSRGVSDILEVLRAHRTRRRLPEYDRRFKVLDDLACSWGFFLYNRHLLWLDQEEFWRTWKNFPASRTQRVDRKFVVWSFARGTRSLEGDTAECGVFTGASSHLICSTCAPETLHHVFDSFEGLSDPSEFDKPGSKEAFRWRRGDLAISESVVRENLRSFPFIRYYKGWIPDRFPEVTDHRFRFVHIDVDLYRPTRDSVGFFYDRLVKGGVLICDDYGYQTCMGARRALDEFVHQRALDPVIHLPTGQGLIVKK